MGSIVKQWQLGYRWWGTKKLSDGQLYPPSLWAAWCGLWWCPPSNLGEASLVEKRASIRHIFLLTVLLGLWKWPSPPNLAAVVLTQTSWRATRASECLMAWPLRVLLDRLSVWLKMHSKLVAELISESMASWLFRPTAFQCYCILPKYWSEIINKGLLPFGGKSARNLCVSKS